MTARRDDAADLDTSAVPEGDALAQREPIAPDHEDDGALPGLDAPWREADPADVADQQRAVPLDDPEPGESLY